jgi:hypothetical protein
LQSDDSLEEVVFCTFDERATEVMTAALDAA